MLLVAAGCRGPATPDAGGEARVVLRADPRTFNPVAALDATSASLVGVMHAALFQVDGVSQQVVPALAERLDAPDASGAMLLHLRDGITFPDGEAFGADDVVFSLQVFQDDALAAPQSQALRVGGTPTSATAIDDRTVRLRFGAPHPDPARLLTGVPMLPRHRLEAAYARGTLSTTWALDTPPEALVGLGPFRLESFVPGQRVTFVRNPSYWRRDAAGQLLPKLDRLTALVVSDPDAQTARLLAGEVDVLSAVDTRQQATLASAAGVTLHDAGPSLEYTFLVLNLDDPRRPGPAASRTRWFQQTAFRQAVSLAIDRPAIARLIYSGLATPLGAHVSPGNRQWHAGIAAPARAVTEARERLRGAGFGWDAAGRLRDAAGAPVTFTLLTSTSNPQRQRIATVVQDDLAALGLEVRVAALEFRALVERVTRTRDFDAAVMALGGGDTDPNAEANVWRLDGATHLWRLGAAAPLAPWEADIDALMRAQAVTVDPAGRRAQYARVQQLVADHLPIVPLVSPNHLVAVRDGLVGVVPAITSRDSLWNVDGWSRAAGRR